MDPAGWGCLIGPRVTQPAAMQIGSEQSGRLLRLHHQCFRRLHMSALSARVAESNASRAVREATEKQDEVRFVQANSTPLAIHMHFCCLRAELVALYCIAQPVQ
jgi:hypothetical protein